MTRPHGDVVVVVIGPHQVHVVVVVEIVVPSGTVSGTSTLLVPLLRIVNVVPFACAETLAFAEAHVCCRNSVWPASAILGLTIGVFAA